MKSMLSDQERQELIQVDSLARRLNEHLVTRRHEIAQVHVHNAKSGAVQLVVAELLKEEIGFDEEVVIEPGLGFVTSARPDFYYQLAPGRGVLAEVERGGTTTNNHDLKDM